MTVKPGPSTWRHHTGGLTVKEQNSASAANELSEPNPYQSLPPEAYWAKSVADRPAADIEVQHEPRFRIDFTTPIASAGSCFAQHIARWLDANGYNYLVAESGPPDIAPDLRRSRGYGLYSARFGNVYTALQLVQLFDRAYGELAPEEPPWRRGDGFVDPFRPRVETFPSVKALFADREQHFAAVRRMFETCGVLIFTLGLTEAWLSRADGSVFPICPGAGAGTFSDDRYEFVNFGVEEVAAHLEAFTERLRRVNPQARLILSVSPVPLAATIEQRPVLQSTVYSKSVLRVAAQQVRDRHEHIEYFASYEMVSHPFRPENAFAADRRTVTDAVVSEVMNIFSSSFTDGRAGSTAVSLQGTAALPPAVHPEPHAPKAQPVVCDELDAYSMEEGHSLLDSREWEFYCGDTNYVYCPEHLRGPGWTHPGTLSPAPDHRLEDFYSVDAWLDTIAERAGDGVILCFGGSHVARIVNWPFNLHAMLDMDTAGSGKVVNMGMFGSAALADRKVLASVLEAFRERGIRIKSAIYLVGVTDVHDRLGHLIRYSRDNLSVFPQAQDRLGLPAEVEIPSRPDLAAAVRPPADAENDLPFFKPSAAWESLIAAMIASAIDSFWELGDAWDLPLTTALQPIATPALYPGHERSVRAAFANSGETKFLSWRKKHKRLRDIGEHHAITFGMPYAVDFDPIYQRLIEHFAAREDRGYVDLTRCFDRWRIPAPNSPFQSDACHYEPTGSAILADTFRRSLFGGGNQ